MYYVILGLYLFMWGLVVVVVVVVVVQNGFL
jgi:hypothetical protein